ncbi:MAG: FAD:protein FMN transferase [Lentisphaeria bacterium]
MYISAVLAAAYVVKVFNRTPENSAKPYVREFRLFGTYGRLTFWAEPAVAKAAADKIYAKLEKVNSKLNLFDKSSELSRLNKNAYFHPVKCSPRLWDALITARRAYRLTDGAFDISIGALMDVWGFHHSRNTYPTKDEVKKALQACGLDKVKFNESARTIRFQHPDMYLDFGGIAKGYALDIAVDIARRQGIESGIIDLGGNLYCFPRPPPGQKTYKIGLKNPLDPASILQVIPARNRTIATSGNYENNRIIDGKEVHHILNPQTGYPVDRIAGVTVITSQSWLSDVFSTAIFIGGDKMVERLRQQDDSRAVLIIKQNRREQPEIKVWQWPAPLDAVKQKLSRD